MAFTLDASDLGTVQLGMPGGGVWMARCSPVEGVAVATGAAVTLTLGGLVLAGTVRRGGVFVYSTAVTVVGGADGWARSLPRHLPYRADNGVRLSSVLADLAADAGERVVLSAAASGAVLGYAWTRPAGVASESLDAACARAGLTWWVGVDGETQVAAARPVVPVPGTAHYTVERVAAERGWALLSCEDDALGAFVPGASVPLGGGAGTMIVDCVDVSVDPRRVMVEVFGPITAPA